MNSPLNMMDHHFQPITIDSPPGTIVIRLAILEDAVQFRYLRLDALQNSPTAFPTDLEKNLNHSISFWENRLKTDEIGTIFFAIHENHLIGMTGIHRGESPKTKHSAYIWGVYVRPE